MKISPTVILAKPISTDRPQFHCTDGKKIIEYSQVNDNYCDCDDNSDEPLTLACRDGLFKCRISIHNGPEFIPNYRVNDRICDCCDGSDEITTGVVCLNSCPLVKQERSVIIQESNDFKVPPQHLIISKNNELLFKDPEFSSKHQRRRIDNNSSEDDVIKPIHLEDGAQLNGTIGKINIELKDAPFEMEKFNGSAVITQYPVVAPKIGLSGITEATPIKEPPLVQSWRNINSTSATIEKNTLTNLNQNNISLINLIRYSKINNNTDVDNIPNFNSDNNPNSQLNINPKKKSEIRFHHQTPYNQATMNPFNTITEETAIPNFTQNKNKNVGHDLLQPMLDIKSGVEIKPKIKVEQVQSAYNMLDPTYNQKLGDEFDFTLQSIPDSKLTTNTKRIIDTKIEKPPVNKAFIKNNLEVNTKINQLKIDEVIENPKLSEITTVIKEDYSLNHKLYGPNDEFRYLINKEFQFTVPNTTNIKYIFRPFNNIVKINEIDSTEYNCGVFLKWLKKPPFTHMTYIGGDFYGESKLKRQSVVTFICDKNNDRISNVMEYNKYLIWVTFRTPAVCSINQPSPTLSTSEKNSNSELIYFGIFVLVCALYAAYYLVEHRKKNN